MSSAGSTLQERIEGEAAEPVVEMLLGSDRSLSDRLRQYGWVRLAVALGLIVGTLIGHFVVGIEQLAVGGLIALALFITGYDAATRLLMRTHAIVQWGDKARRRLLRLLYGTIVLDYLSLTVAVWLLGGAYSPFLIFYLLHVILGCILLTRRMAIFSAVLAYVLLAALIVGQWGGWLPVSAPTGAVAGSAELDDRYALTLLIVFAIMFGLTVFLLLGLSELLRRSERELREANAMLHQLSTVRRDFLQIAVHDVRAPIGGVVMMLSNLNNGLCGRLDDEQKKWIQRCLKRLDGLSELLGDLRALSYLETSDIDAQKTCVDLRKMLADLVEEHRGLAGDHQHELIAEIPEHLPGVMGVERLLREAVANYITNAIKYTPDGGRIVVRARSADHVVRIEVQDNGIGIAPKDQRRLFEEFVRVKVAGTTVSNVTGSGLGLSIVRHVVEKHGGLVGVRSRPRKGSTFFIHLPAADRMSAEQSAPVLGAPE